MSQEWMDLRAAVAQKNGVSPQDVERELRLLIDHIWLDGTEEGRRQLRLAGWGRKPSPFQLIGYLARISQQP